MGNNAFLKYYICCSQNMVCVPVVAHGPIVVGCFLYWDVKSKSSKNFIKYLICVKKCCWGLRTQHILFLKIRHICNKKHLFSSCCFFLVGIRAERPSTAMAILFAVVARGTTILAKHAWCSGNFLEVTEQILAKIPSENNKLTYSHGR